MRRLAGVAGAVAVLLVIAAPPADAHTITGVAPTNYRSEIVAVTPKWQGVSVRLLDLGNRVELVNSSRTDVVVLGYQGEPYLRVGPYGVHYFLGVPKTYDRTKPWSLVIKLPTAHAFVTNPPPVGDEVARIYSSWINDDLARHPEAIVIMPLLNLDELYGPSQAGMDTVIQPMLHACGLANVDVTRVSLIGHSMAAHAVWNLGLHYPTDVLVGALLGAASGVLGASIDLMSLI